MSSLTSDRYTGSYRSPVLEHATVGDVMHPGVVSCSPDTTARELARMMASHHVHCIMVMGISGAPGEEHLVWRTVSDLDLLRLDDSRELGQAAASLAREPILTVDPAMSLNDAKALMRANGVSHALVVDGRHQRPAGVLSTMDVIGAMAWGEA